MLLLLYICAVFLALVLLIFTCPYLHVWALVCPSCISTEIYFCAYEQPFDFLWEIWYHFLLKTHNFWFTCKICKTFIYLKGALQDLSDETGAQYKFLKFRHRRRKQFILVENMCVHVCVKLQFLIRICCFLYRRVLIGLKAMSLGTSTAPDNILITGVVSTNA